MRKRLYFTLGFTIFSLTGLVFGNSIYITSVLPYTDDDTNMEYIELTNFSTGTISLSGYSIKDKSGKTYYFTSQDGVLPSESKKFFRPETKIILNNTDEELWLNDNFFMQLDNFAYVASNKNEKIDTGHFPILDIANVSTGSYADNADLTMTGGYNDIQYVAPSFTSSGMIAGITDKEATLDLISFTGSGFLDIAWGDGNQTFSGMVLGTSYTFYNLHPETSYTYSLRLNSDTGAMIDSATGSFKTMSIGGMQLIVIESPNGNTGTLSNSGNVSDTGSHILSESGSSISSGQTSDGQNALPEIYISFQQPTYLVLKTGTVSGYDCDTSKSDCKANFSLLNSFSGGFKESDYICKVEVSSGNAIDSCNPDTISFSGGKTSIVFSIIDKSDVNNYISKKIDIFNIRSISATISSSSNGTSSVSQTQPQTLYSSIAPANSKEATAVISLQGSLGTSKKVEGKIIYCIGVLECNLNFSGEKSINAKYFDWNFGNGVHSGNKNPASVRFLSGSYRIILNVSNDYGYLSTDNYEVKFIDLPKSNSGITSKAGDVSASSGIQANKPSNNDVTKLLVQTGSSGMKSLSAISKSESVIDDFKLAMSTKIILQGKISKNLYRKGDIIYCQTTGNCKINFAINEKKIKNMKYLWDFGNSTKSEMSNPKEISYKPGKYFVTLGIIAESGSIIRTERLGISVTKIIPIQSKKPTAKKSAKAKTSKAKSTPAKKTAKEKQSLTKENTLPNSDNSAKKTVSVTLGFTGLLGVVGYFTKKYTNLFFEP